MSISKDEIEGDLARLRGAVAYFLIAERQGQIKMAVEVVNEMIDDLEEKLCGKEADHG